MAKNSTFLAYDFGAESGRAVLGIIEDDKLRLEEIHRFPNTPVRTLGSLHWDILRLFGEVKHGLWQALQMTDGKLDGIGVDTWGVDFGLIGDDGELLGNPFHYRDERTNGMMEEVFKIVPRREIFERTGIQFMQLNSLFQLFAMARASSPALANARMLLMMPDLFNYWLTGVMTGEFSNATTTQCYDPRKGDWAQDMLEKLGIPTHLFPPIVLPGTVIGRLHPTLVAELGMGGGVDVVAPATHDTGSAVAAVPADGDGHAYLSSGTWSLMGVELTEPLINEKSYENNYTNEGGVAGTFRFLRNIMGLWIVQECRRTWLAEGTEVTYAELAAMAEESPAYVSLVNPDACVFLPPGNMPKRVREYCQDTGQPVPESMGAVVRCILDSLSLRYRATIEDLEDILGRTVSPLHAVGGGIQNRLLCQLTANATGKTVLAGPIEATAIGNILVQAIGKGTVSSVAEAREIVRASFDLETYEPRDTPGLQRAYDTFKQLPQ